MGQGGWDDPRARATRGRRLPSLDARNWDHPSHPLLSDSSLRPCLGQGASRRARVGRVRKLAFLSILPTTKHSERLRASTLTSTSACIRSRRSLQDRVILCLRQPVHA